MICIRNVFLSWKNVFEKKTKPIDKWNFHVKILISLMKDVCIFQNYDIDGGKKYGADR